MNKKFSSAVLIVVSNIFGSRSYFRLVVLLFLLALLSLPAFAQRPATFYMADATVIATAWPSDQAVLDRLRALGFSVTVITGADSDVSQAAGQDLIVISSTLGSGTIADKFTAT